MSVVSAQVVLSPAGIRVWRDVARHFSNEGFTCGPLVANNFSIAADTDTFNRSLNVRVVSAPTGAVYFDGPRGVPQYELSGAALPESMRDMVASIVLTRLPDFGPTSW